MDAIEQILRSTEEQIVALANDASARRDYEGATALLGVARRVKSLADEATSELPATSGATGIPDASDRMPSPTVTDAPPPRNNPRVRKTDYPKFLRDGGTLIKVGWSKTEKSEYEHKSPKKVLLALGHTLVEASAKSRLFSMDKLLPISDPTDDTQLPDYQCYVSLAWLRQTGLIIQHGRQGYSLPKKGDLIASIERFWEQLPVKS